MAVSAKLLIGRFPAGTRVATGTALLIASIPAKHEVAVRMER